MSFLQLWPLSFLVFIPLVILLYILKQKAEDQMFSSTFLWQEVYKSVEVNTPWERLKKNFLLFIQLITILLFIITLMHPHIRANYNEHKNVIIVIDNSGSMNTNFDNTTRFEKSIESATEYIKSLNENTTITIVSNANTPTLEAGSITGKDNAIDILKSIETTDMSGDISDSFSLINAMVNQWDDYEVAFFTDQNIELNNMQGRVFLFNQQVNNGSVDYVSHSYEEDFLNVLVKVTNRSDEVLSSDINLYGDNELLDIATINLDPRESKIIYFNELEFNGHIIKAELNKSDGLMNDNIAYDIVTQINQTKILLVTEKNVFIEKVLNTFSHVDVYKTNDPDLINETDNYDVYIFDGIVPDVLPTKGNLLITNPPDQELFEVNGDVEGGTVKSIPSEITNYLDQMNFYINKYKSVEEPSWSKSFLEVNGGSAGFYGQNKGQNIMVLTFDLHETDLVLKPEFPMLMHNIMTELMNVRLLKKVNFKAGEAVSFNTISEGGSIKVISPNGKEEEIPLRFPIRDYLGTEKTGLYKVEQTISEGLIESYFVVNYPTELESSTNNVTIEDNMIKENNQLPQRNLDLTMYLIIGLLLIICVEWIVYIRRY
ncbi:MAG: vWA domain-containing protein [Eubacteriales bacterium]